MFDNGNWSCREICIDRGKEICLRIARDTWNSGISPFCAWLNTSASIRKYSLFYRAAFLLTAVSSSSPRRRDFLSGKEKHADHKRRFKKTSWLDANCTFSKHRATTPRHAPEVRASWKKLCFLLAQFELTSSSGVLRALRHFDGISRETRPCLRRVKWKGGSQKDRVTGKWERKKERKKVIEERGRNLLPRFARL